ncbi:hypothetical protein [Nocardia macrotermitis]|uniref:Uncharacterized protein n=1 Tax=Nocardia macrotermitis TaxID=2585198 RepID=A0A7K0DF51_9NOCA|nr:hypothetical protein [Nocardia macrotermitis]MQY24420.1 hypothetical protein [Nocardia macrotermitis]
MTIFHLAGADTSALTHFALYGLANIVESETTRTVLLRWNPENRTAELDLDGLHHDDIGQAVHSHATRCAEPTSWLHARVDHGGRPNTAAFSPRIKLAARDQEWRTLQNVRNTHLDTLLDTNAYLDLAMIGGLGEPAHWRFVGKERRPDHGASRWEMKTRNQGEEFVGQRLLPMAEAVANRTSDAILEGLAGKAVIDELAGRKPNSQTATGFTRPATTDCALAWCALWGITNFPTIHRISTISRTPAAYPTRVLHPTTMVLPIITAPITTARLRTVLLSEAFDTIADHLIAQPDDEPDATATDASSKWLAARGIPAVMVFPIQKIGSDAAPQRIILAGQVELLPSV